MTLRDKSLVNTWQVECASDRVTDVTCLIDALVAWLGTRLVWDHEVGNVLACVLEVEAGAGSCHTQVDHNVVICPLQVLSDPLEDLIKRIVAALNVYIDDLGVLKFEAGLITCVCLEQLNKISDNDTGGILKDRTKLAEACHVEVDLVSLLLLSFDRCCLCHSNIFYLLIMSRIHYKQSTGFWGFGVLGFWGK